mgnify:CR=1 FL=1
MRVIGGCCTRWISVARSGLSPACQATEQDRRQQNVLAALQRHRRRCPASASRLETVVCTRSRSSSGSSSVGRRKRFAAPTPEHPAVAAGRVGLVNSAASRSRRMRAPSSSPAVGQPKARPPLPLLGRAANCSECDSSASAGLVVGDPRRENPPAAARETSAAGWFRSPFGSMTMAGTPSRRGLFD